MNDMVRRVFDRWGEGDPSRTTQWVIHHPLRSVFIGWLVEVVGVHFADGWVRALGLVVVVWMIYYYLKSVIKHSFGVCDRCLARPYGGPQAAQKHLRDLQYMHWRMETPFLATMMGIMVISLLPRLILLPYPELGKLVASTLIWTILGVQGRWNLLHGWLQPWCPWCRDDGGGGEEHAEVPDPVPSGVKTSH